MCACLSGARAVQFGQRFCLLVGARAMQFGRRVCLFVRSEGDVLDFCSARWQCNWARVFACLSGARAMQLDQRVCLFIRCEGNAIVPCVCLFFRCEGTAIGPRVCLFVRSEGNVSACVLCEGNAIGQASLLVCSVRGHWMSACLTARISKRILVALLRHFSQDELYPYLDTLL